MSVGFSSAILACSFGPASLRLTGYRRSDEAILNGQGDRTGTALTIECTGELVAEDASGLAAALDAWHDALATSGFDFSITRGGATVEQIEADDCTRGPHVQGAYTDAAPGPASQGVQFTVTAETTAGATGSGDGELGATREVRTEVDETGVTTITTTGEVRTADGTSASDAAAAKVPDRDVAYALRYETRRANSDDTEARYSASQRQLASAMPNGGLYTGERTLSTRWDDNRRELTTTRWDYAGPGAAAYVAAQVAAARAAGGVRTATYEELTHGEQRARGSVETVAGAGGDELLELTETLTRARTGPLLEARSYPGTTPLIASGDTPAWRYEQTGRAVAVGRYPRPAQPSFAEQHYAEAPQITTRKLSELEGETAWTYVYLFESEQGRSTPAAEPDGFYGGTL